MNDDGDVFGETTTLFKLVRVVDMAIMATDRWDLPIFTHRVSGTRWGGGRFCQEIESWRKRRSALDLTLVVPA